MDKKYFIQTFGCQQNEADSERIASYLKEQGYMKVSNIKNADCIVINTCMIREMAENRVYGLINNLKKLKSANRRMKIILTGCMVGMAVRERTGKFLKLLKKRMPIVDEFLPIEEIGFEHLPLRGNKKIALVPISQGCNNFCSYCVVPYSRGREISRPYLEILKECKELERKGFAEIMLLGMNVNSYGADLILGDKSIQKTYFENSKFQNPNTKQIPNSKIQKLKQNIVYVKHLGRLRIPTLFPSLLSDICKIKGFEKISFMSSNPWDFSDELIDVIKNNPIISREIHLPVQSGSNSVLKRMNRWYTKEQYSTLYAKLTDHISGIKISTDIIVGFCGETDEEFEDTVLLCKKIYFSKAYIAIYSDRPMTAAHKTLEDDIPFKVKKSRWKILEDLINKPNLVSKKT